MTTDEHIEYLSNQLALATESLKIQMAVKELVFKEVDRLTAALTEARTEAEKYRDDCATEQKPSLPASKVYPLPWE